jgi:hypothetical protein
MNVGCRDMGSQIPHPPFDTQPVCNKCHRTEDESHPARQSRWSMYALLRTPMATRYGLRSRLTLMTRDIKSSGMQQPGSYVTRGRPVNAQGTVKSRKILTRALKGADYLPYLNALKSNHPHPPELGEKDRFLVRPHLQRQLTLLGPSQRKIRPPVDHPPIEVIPWL